MHTLRGEDGKDVSAILRPPRREGSPGVVLVAAYGAIEDHYSPILEALFREGYGGIAFALPENGIAAEGAVKPALFVLIDGAVSALSASGSQADRIAVAGVGAGATVAAFHAASRQEIEGVILVSPALTEQGLRIETPFSKLFDRPILLMAGENDAYAASTARELKAQAAGFCELRVYPGAAHGLDLFALHGDALAQFMQWLQTCIPADPQFSGG